MRKNIEISEEKIMIKKNENNIKRKSAPEQKVLRGFAVVSGLVKNEYIL